MVITNIQAYSVSDVPHRTNSELCRRVFIDFLAITELINCRNLAGFIYSRLVLHVNLSLELILCCQIELSKTIIDTDNRSNTYA